MKWLNLCRIWRGHQQRYSRLLSFAASSLISGKIVEDVMPIATSHDREEIEAEIRVFFHWIDCLFCLCSSQRAMAEVESAKALTLAVHSFKST
ncbi:hypothetical protein Scep_021835 [Stephania cephalantha]|uniref:Uncharacterized protein n=1 Tax=Stephania cephalantha TaxID=152367 RepID=A0AAP0F467_9MAGN